MRALQGTLHIFFFGKVHERYFRPYLIPLQNLIFFKILRHIESLNVCMEY